MAGASSARGRVASSRRRVERLVLDHVGHDAAVAHRDDPRRARGDVALVRDEHDGDPAVAVELLQEREDLEAGARVEVARGLVGQEQRRIGHERARDRDALLLAAGELVGRVVEAVPRLTAVERRRARGAVARGR